MKSGKIKKKQKMKDQFLLSRFENPLWKLAKILRGWFVFENSLREVSLAKGL